MVTKVVMPTLGGVTTSYCPPGFAANAPAAAPSPLLYDAFWGTNGDLMTAHTPDSGGSYTLLSGTNPQISGNSLLALSTANFRITDPVGSDGVIVLNATYGTFQHATGVYFRTNDTLTEFWGAWLDDGFVRLQCSDGSYNQTNSTLGSNVGKLRRIVVEFSGSSIVVTVDGVELFNITSTSFMSNEYVCGRFYQGGASWQDITILEPGTLLLFDTFRGPSGVTDIDVYAGSEFDKVGGGWSQVPGSAGWQAVGTLVNNTGAETLEGSYQYGSGSEATGAFIDVGATAKTIIAQIFHSTTAFHWVGLLVRYEDDQNFVYARITHDRGLQLVQKDAGVGLILDENTTKLNWSTTHSVMIAEDDGENITVTVRWAGADYVVSATPTAAVGSTKVGSYFYKTLSRLEKMLVMG